MDTPIKRLDTVQTLLLTGHLFGFLSVLLLSAGQLMRTLRNTGDLPDTPFFTPPPTGAPPPQPQRRTGYFDRAGGF